MDAVTPDAPLIGAGEGSLESDWLAWPGLQTMPRTSAAALVPDGARAVVVAPHPDDEVLTVGGLLVQLAARGHPICVVAVTDGDASHPGSRQWPAALLARTRARETRSALQRLGVAADTLRLGLPDGELRARQRVLADRLAQLLRPTDVVFTTWREDGHPDHDATGEACALATARVGARLVEVPVWAWHWAAPGDARLPWRRARRLALTPLEQHRKRRAVQSFATQLTADASTGAGPILRRSTVARAARPFEVVFA